MIMELKEEARAQGGCRASEKKKCNYFTLNKFLMGWMDLMKYSKSWLIRINWVGGGTRSSGLVKQKAALKDEK
jgi:hypothetical protein